MRKLLSLLTFIVLYALSASAATVRYAPTAQGSANGTSCDDAYAYNDATNGINTAGKWVADNILEVCSGTYTVSAVGNFITSAGSGTSGHVVTVHIDDGAVIQATYFAVTGGIRITHNYVTVEGVSTGKIQNTRNGTTGGACIGGACNVQQGSILILVTGTHVTVQNIIALGAYVKTEGTNDPGHTDNTAISMEGDNGLAAGNTVTNAYTGINASASNVTISGNVASFCNHCYTASSDTADISNIIISGNESFSMYNWDEPDNAYHHNHAMVFTGNSGTPSVNDVQIYNNYFHGMNSRDAVYADTHITAWIFFDCTPPGVCLNSLVFNNILEADEGDFNYPANSYITGGSAYNNTVFDNGNGGLCWKSAGPDTFYKNNLCQTTLGGALGGAWLVANVTANSQIDYNLYAGIGVSNNFTVPLGNVNSWSVWASGSWQDPDPRTIRLDINGSNPSAASTLLDSSYVPGVGGTADGACTNLTSLAITALNSDKTGSARPLMGAWDCGAYNVGSTPLGPQVSLSVSSHDFGDQTVNVATGAYTITLTNTGDADLNITTTVLTTGTQYALSANTCSSQTVAPSATCSINVTFTPTSTGAKADTLTYSDDASDSPQTVSLSGTGVNANTVSGFVGGGAKLSGGGKIQ